MDSKWTKLGFGWLKSKQTEKAPDTKPEPREQDSLHSRPLVLKHGQAMRVIFHFPEEDSTYVDHAMVTLFESGIVHIKSQHEETTTHVQYCEVLWRYESDESAAQVTPLRVIRSKGKDAPPAQPEK